MLIGQEASLAYALKHGTGWRADCLGDICGGEVIGKHRVGIKLMSLISFNETVVPLHSY